MTRTEQNFNVRFCETCTLRVVEGGEWRQHGASLMRCARYRHLSSMWPCLLSSFLHFVWAGDAVALCGVGNVVFIAIVIDKRERELRKKWGEIARVKNMVALLPIFTLVCVVCVFCFAILCVNVDKCLCFLAPSVSSSLVACRPFTLTLVFFSHSSSSDDGTGGAAQVGSTTKGGSSALLPTLI